MCTKNVISYVVRFHLTLNDEGDNDHWMFATTAAATDLSLNKEKEEDNSDDEKKDPLT